jgi:DNA-binding transcriptional MerR regulator
MKSAPTLGYGSDALSVSKPSQDELAGEAGRECTIGELAAEFGVSLRTLRFYEDRRLLRPRREGTMRIYSGVDRLRLQMILKGKQLGFTLSEIAELIGAQNSGDDFEEKLQPAQITTQIDHLERQRRDIDEAIARLRATHSRLAEASTSPKQYLAVSG